MCQIWVQWWHFLRQLVTVVLDDVSYDIILCGIVWFLDFLTNCIHRKSRFGDVIKQSGYLVYWMFTKILGAPKTRIDKLWIYLWARRRVFCKGAKNCVSHWFPLYQPLVTFQGHFLRENVKTAKLDASALPPSLQHPRLKSWVWPDQWPGQCIEILGSTWPIIYPYLVLLIGLIMSNSLQYLQ